MTNLSFKKYRFTIEELVQLEENYVLLLENVDLNNLTISEHINVLSQYEVGVYFWVMTIDMTKYKIYIGKTNSIERRVKDYCGGFQIHSPNDYKMRFFQSFIASNVAKFSLSLHFSAQEKHNYTAAETESINFFKPMINQRLITKSSHKKQLKEAYEVYYHNVFKLKLDD